MDLDEERWVDGLVNPDLAPLSTVGHVVGPTGYFWRQVGTDIEVRVVPDPLSTGQAWQYQAAPTGLLTIHLVPPGTETVEPVEIPDPLDPLETPGPTFVRQAEWDEETQRWI